MSHFVIRRLLLSCTVLAIPWCGCTRLHPTESTYLESGKNKLARGDYARAVLEFRNAAKLAPRDPEPFYQLALTHEKIGDLPTTVAFLRKAIQLDGGCFRAHVKLAEVMAGGARGDKSLLAEAEQHARAALGSNEDANARRALALTVWQQGKRDEAQQILKATTEKFPGDVKAALAFAKMTLTLGHISAAEEVLQRAAARSPGAEADLALADLYLTIGRNSDAARLFRSVAQRDKRNAEALLGLAVAQLRQGQTNQADQTYQQVSSIPVEKYRPLHAEFLLQSGHRDQGIAELEQLVKQDPKNRHFSAMLLSAYLAANRRGAAEQFLDNLLKQNAKNKDALLERARLYITDHKLREADVDLNHVLSIQPDSADAHYLKASVHALNGENLNAQQELSEALRLSASHLTARIELARSLIQANSAQAALNVCNSAPDSQRNAPQLIIERNRALLVLGNLQELRASIDKGLKIAPTPELLLQDGQLRLRQRDFTGARADAKAVLLKQPDNVNALDLLAGTYTARKQIGEAVQAIREYAATRPSSVSVQDYYARILAAHGDVDASRKIFETLRNKSDNAAAMNSEFALAQIVFSQGNLDQARQLLNPLVASGNLPATLYLAVVETQAQRFSTAMDDYRKVLASDPTNVVALNNLAFLLLEHGGNPVEALKFAQNAAERTPDNPDVQGTLAVALYRNGVYQNARDHMRAALAAKDSAIRRYYLSLIYNQLGNLDESRSNLQAALRLDPKVVSERQNR